MNQPPPRHPLFVAIACIALAGAWSTGAHEAQTGATMALAQAASLPDPLAVDCAGPRGPARALCLFEASRPPNTGAPLRPPAFAEATGAVIAPAVSLASRKDATRRDLP